MWIRTRSIPMTNKHVKLLGSTTPNVLARYPKSAQLTDQHRSLCNSLHKSAHRNVELRLHTLGTTKDLKADCGSPNT